MAEKFDLERKFIERCRAIQEEEIRRAGGAWPQMERTWLRIRDEACAAQAEEIAQRIDGQHLQHSDESGFSTHSCSCCAAIARSFAAPTPPRSREEVYRNALEKIANGIKTEEVHRLKQMTLGGAMITLAQEALSYTPQGGGGAGG